jgi:Domain of unknown function (DUF4331)
MNFSRLIGRAALSGFLLVPAHALASSHMDAPLITFDDPANTTDVYGFVSQRGGQKYLTTAVALYPFEEPGIGPNAYDFDPNVLYELHVALGSDLAAGRATISYQYRFQTFYKNVNTILQSYLGVVNFVDDESQNRVQVYTVTKLDRRTGQTTVLGTGIVPPNNQGNATPRYNRGNNGENPAKDGVGTVDALDPYTSQTVFDLSRGYRSFAGQRDDGFYADVQATFDLLRLRGAGLAQDSQGGFNVHTIVLDIPTSELGGDMQNAGVYATTSRQAQTIISPNGDPVRSGPFVQVGRQGNPLFCEVFVAIKDKDRYNRTAPTQDASVFATYALNPELAVLINKLVFGDPEGDGPVQTMNRQDLAGIFIPDVIKVDLSTPAARLAGGGPTHPTNPDDQGFSRLSVFGGDVLPSALTNGNVAGGWPNGRRFGDDVFDIGVSAVVGLGVVVGDNVNGNEIAYNKVFPYAATPLNGRTHPHHGF